MPPRRSLRSQKKQTTLQFSPLPSSSPAKNSYSQAVQDRLASVRYEGIEGSPQKPDERSREAATLPTPEPSSQYRDSTDIHNRLASAPPSSPPHLGILDVDLGEETDEDDLILSPQKKRKLSSNVSESLPISSSSRRRSTRLHPNSSTHLPRLSNVEDAGGPHSSTPSRRSGRLQRGSPSRSLRSDRAESSTSNISVEIPSLSLHQSRYSDLGSAETSDDEDAIMASRPTSRRKSKAAVDDPFVVDDDTIQYHSDDDDVRKQRTPKRRQNPSDAFVVNDDIVEYITSDNDEVRDTRKAPKSHKPLVNPAPPKTPRRRTRKEQEELDEDLQDLQDSEPETSAIKSRTRGGPVTTERDKTREHFELLKRRRAGEKVPRIEDSEETDTEESEAVDIDLISAPHYEVSHGGSVVSSNDAEQESGEEQDDQEEEDFVVEDSHGRLGRPYHDIPLQFTSFASAKPRELFPHIIEWLVKNKLAPAFSRDDELYNLAFNRVDDQVKAQAGSRLISSAWGTAFKRAILARPNVKVVRLPGEDIDNIRDCDACNRTNHPARYEFVFSGEPYFQKTLEPVENSDEEDEYDDDASRDENGHVLASQHQRFYLGRFCAANAEMGHKLTHWKYHLNQALMSYLEEQGVLSAEAIVARERTNKKKREKEAENIVDSMQETGVIADFWADFENDLNDARLGMEDYEKKGGRSKGRVGTIRSTFVRD